MPTPHTQSGAARLIGQPLVAWCRRMLVQPMADALLAQSCALCHLPSGAAPLCPACARDLPNLPPVRCPQCALPATGGLSPNQCPDCARHRPSFDRATAVWAYAFPVDTLIRDFKYGHHLYLGRFFADHLAETLLADWGTTGRPRPDLIVPMPLHPNRLRARGFNQAAEIARHLSRRLGVSCTYDTLLRLHDTPPQAGLHRDARWHNLIGAFGCPRPIGTPRILLVDDVLTTGASLSACADTLHQAGATHVDVAVIARTLTP